MRRVCIIIDHPQRDLDGGILLAAQLATRGLEVFLVPMYSRHEVLFLHPDLVLVNYVRFANVAFIDACLRLGIRVGVLDTEGGVLKDVDDYARRVSPHLSKLSLYCAWGTRQSEALRRAANGAGAAIVATGCPRYDFACPPWRDALQDVGPEFDRMVLVNTNFPIANPRFQTATREVRELIQGIRYDADYVSELMAQTRLARGEVIRATALLAGRFPGVIFVVRPHPFEERRTYEDELRSVPNVVVIQRGTSFEWLKKAAVLVHHNCSTAVEAFLTGCEPIHLEWIRTPLLEQPVSVAVSHRARSPEDLVDIVGRRLRGETLPVPQEVGEQRRRVIEEHFLANDGRAAARVADAVDQILNGEKEEGRPGQPFSPLEVVVVQQGWRRKTQTLLFVLIGPRLYDLIRGVMRRRRNVEGKRFGAVDVHDVLTRLQRVAPDLVHLEAALAGRKDVQGLVRGELSAVKISPRQGAGTAPSPRYGPPSRDDGEDGEV